MLIQSALNVGFSLAPRFREFVTGFASVLMASMPSLNADILGVVWVVDRVLEVSLKGVDEWSRRELMEMSSQGATRAVCCR